MVDFSHLSQLDVKKEKTVNYRLYQIEDEPTLVLSSATEANKPYFNALLRKSKKNLRAIQSKAINVDTVTKNREEDKALYAKYIVKGWCGVKDASGNDVEFSEENASDFLYSLPNWIFDEIRSFASDIQNFVDELPDTEETAKN